MMNIFHAIFDGARLILTLYWINKNGLAGKRPIRAISNS
jgi:hypothetical protein